MQFKVPQFLDIEDKIFGPFTFRQFIYIAGGAGLCFVFYRLLGLIFGAIPILIVGGLAGMLAFYRPNDKPFINMLESGFKYTFQNKLYIWKRRKKTAESKAQDKATADIKIQSMNYSTRNETRLGASKLKDLAWSLDVLDTKKNSGNE